MEEFFYFKKIKDQIYKYAIEFDRDEVEALILEIKENCGVVNCSDILNHEYVASEKIYIKTLENIQNGESEKNVFFVEYVYPYLVNLIKKLLEKNTDCISEIYNPNEDEYYDILGEKNENSLLVSPFDYYSKLQALINIRVEDKISVTTIKDVEDFFDIAISDVKHLTNNKKGVLKAARKNCCRRVRK